MDQNPKAKPTSPFWQFSLRFYGEPEVPAACIVLQDQAGVDVNLLLFLLFLAEHRRQIQSEDIARLDKAIGVWRDGVVKPLREMRRGLKTGIGEVPTTVSERFRGKIKHVELESEHIEQLVLETFGVANLGSPAGSAMRAAEANFAAYETYLGGVPAEPRALILAAFARSQP